MSSHIAGALLTALILILVTTHGNATETQVDIRSFCSIETRTDPIVCYFEDKEIRSYGQTFTAGTECYFNSDDNFIVLVCKDGSWVTSEYDGLPHHRRRRFIFMSLLVTKKAVIASVAVSKGVAGAAAGGVSLLGGLICIFFCGRNNGPNAIIPPTITCPDNTHTTALRGETSAIANWEDPTYTCGSGECSVTRIPDGNRFSEGRTAITYSVVNGYNSERTCNFDFTVTVVTCWEPQSPANGRIACQNSDRHWGTSCPVVCNNGHELANGDAAIECGENGQWIGQPSCERITCPGEPPEVAYATLDCTGTHCGSGSNEDPHSYGCQCAYTCIDGYSGNPGSATCNSNSIWITGPPSRGPCVDSTRPEIHNCPENIEEIAEPLMRTAVATWPEINATDNSGSVTVTREGPGPGSYFEGEINSIVYTATDPTGNYYPCSFNVRVIVLSCPPITFSPYLMVNCPEELILGSSCSFSCDLGLPLNGTSEATCIHSIDNPGTAQWDLSPYDFIPFCIAFACNDMRPPRNGALAYDTFFAGQLAFIFCNIEFDLPIQRPDNGMYVCSLASGDWQPSFLTPPPDCVERFFPRDAELEDNRHKFFSGDCNDPETQEQIRESYMKRMRDSMFYDICRLIDDCRAENVRVECGEADRRRKRSTLTHVITITFDLMTKIEFGDGKRDHEELNAETQTRLFEMVNKVRNEFESGKLLLDVTDLPTEPYVESHTNGVFDLDCPDSMESNFLNYTCRMCSTGSYYNSSKKECDPCKVGEYQDEAGKFACDTCKTEESTIAEGSRNDTECKRTCRPGQFSDSGLIPCALCPQGTFQSSPHSKFCNPCPIGTYSSPGSIACTTFDASFGYDSSLKMHHITKAPLENITLAFQIVLMENSTSGVQHILSLHGEDSSLSITTDGEKLHATMGVMAVSSPVTTESWQHIAVTFKLKSLQCAFSLYVDGSLIEEKEMDGGSCASFSVDTHLALGQDLFTKGARFHMTALQIWDEVLSPSAIDEHSSMCIIEEYSLLQWSDVRHSSNYTEMNFLPLTSCGANWCENDPCNGHTCTNQLRGHKCECDDGFDGLDCSINLDPCSPNPCHNGGTCHREDGRHQCDCTDTFYGLECKDIIAPGYWSGWSDLTDCSELCGGGISEATRACIKPHEKSTDCLGEDKKIVPCNEDACPECPPFPSPPGTYAICTEELFVKNCSMQCEGYLFYEFIPLEYYICGPGSDYKWAGGDDELALEEFPSCSEMVPPEEMVLDMDIVYDGDPCSVDKDEATKQMLENADFILKESSCVTSGACKHKVEIYNCGDDGRRKRSLEATHMSVYIKATFPQVDLYVDGEFQHEEGMEFLAVWNVTVIDLDVIGIWVNHSAYSGYYDLEINGEYFATNTDYSTVKGEVLCRKGSASALASCNKCPLGRYEKKNKCEICPKGYYQDRMGQIECEPCPEGETTEAIGATDRSMCVEIQLDPEPDNQESRVLLISLSVVFSLCAVFAVIFIVWWCKVTTAKRSKVGSVPDMKSHETPYPIEEIKDKKLLEEKPCTPPPKYDAFERLDNVDANV